jgi:hypothetical protein
VSIFLCIQHFLAFSERKLLIRMSPYYRFNSTVLDDYLHLCSLTITTRFIFNIQWKSHAHKKKLVFIIMSLFRWSSQLLMQANSTKNSISTMGLHYNCITMTRENTFNIYTRSHLQKEAFKYMNIQQVWFSTWKHQQSPHVKRSSSFGNALIEHYYNFS